jgi:hypothetical protein
VRWRAVKKHPPSKKFRTATRLRLSLLNPTIALMDGPSRPLTALLSQIIGMSNSETGNHFFCKDGPRPTSLRPRYDQDAHLRNAARVYGGSRRPWPLSDQMADELSNIDRWEKMTFLLLWAQLPLSRPDVRLLRLIINSQYIATL